MSSIIRHHLAIETGGRGSYEITDLVGGFVSGSSISEGLCNLFLRHTSASLMICENADASVRSDLEMFMARLVIDGDPAFVHQAEGEDDMAAHIRSILTHTSITIPIEQNQLALGEWQGIYLWEHRIKPHNREVVVTVYS